MDTAECLVSYKDKKLGKWVQHQRILLPRATFQRFRKQRLDEIGFDWDPHEADWEEGFRYLRSTRSARVIVAFRIDHKENGFRLGQWVRVQRHNADTCLHHADNNWTSLDLLGPLMDADWAEGFRYLTIYKKREGHCRVPASHKEDGFRLGRWVIRQRQRKRSLSRNVDEDWTNLDLFGTRSKRIGRKDFVI